MSYDHKGDISIFVPCRQMFVLGFISAQDLAVQNHLKRSEQKAFSFGSLGFGV